MGIRARVASFGTPLSSEEITVPSSGVSSGLTIPAAAVGCLVSVGTGTQVRWRSDGTNPTASVGHPLDVDAYAEFGRGDMDGLVFASAESLAGSVFVTYYKD